MALPKGAATGNMCHNQNWKTTMATDTNAQKIAADYDAVTAQISALRDDLAKMAKSMSATTTQRGQAIVRDVTDGVNEAISYVGRKGHETDKSIEAAVSANPYMALAVAAGMGLLVGALSRR